MKIFERFGIKPGTVLRSLLIGAAAVVTLAFILQFLDGAVTPLMRKGGLSVNSIGMGDSDAYSYAPTSPSGKMMADMSPRNVKPQSESAPGDQAEEIEVTEYNARIESSDSKETCKQVTDLKARDYIVFESATTGERDCYLRFKVEKGNVSEVLEFIKRLNPRELTDRTFTIEQQVNDYTAEAEILVSKRNSIDETLKNATEAYNEISVLATRTQNVDSLAKIIDSKVQLIDRLTQERVKINNDLDRLQREKEKELDRTKYTTFEVAVYENPFVDWRGIKDTWKEAIRDFFFNFNKSLQAVSIGLLVFLLYILQLAIYLLLILVLAKLGWKLAKKIWTV
ncbi:MAG TPA: hypothetical protein VEA59_04385 [Patescibacteria group bacterium]|nr:hypothetical protein [Patescibacteria group bacterium]